LLSTEERDGGQKKPVSDATHLSPAEAGQLLGRSAAGVRDMIRRGDLTQEPVDGRLLIPAREVKRYVNRQRKPIEKRVPEKGMPEGGSNQEKWEGKLSKNKKRKLRRYKATPSLEPASDISSSLTSRKTYGLTADIRELREEDKAI
jgi:hypothetical protein